MANLDLSDSAVAAERDVVLEERRMRVDNDPEALTEEQADAALYLSHPYGRPVIGWPDEIRHIGRAEAEDFYQRHYAPNNAILIVAGDVTADEVRAAAEAEYGQVPGARTGGARRLRAAAAARRDAPGHRPQGRESADVPAPLSRPELCRGGARTGRGAGGPGAGCSAATRPRRSIAGWWWSASSPPTSAPVMTVMPATPASSILPRTASRCGAGRAGARHRRGGGALSAPRAQQGGTRSRQAATGRRRHVPPRQPVRNGFGLCARTRRSV